MRQALVLFGLIGLTLASPSPQLSGIDLEVVKAAGAPSVSAPPLAPAVYSEKPAHHAPDAASDLVAVFADGPGFFDKQPSLRRRQASASTTTTSTTTTSTTTTSTTTTSTSTTTTSTSTSTTSTSTSTSTSTLTSTLTSTSTSTTSASTSTTLTSTTANVTSVSANTTVTSAPANITSTSTSSNLTTTSVPANVTSTPSNTTVTSTPANVTSTSAPANVTSTSTMANATSIMLNTTTTSTSSMTNVTSTPTNITTTRNMTTTTTTSPVGTASTVGNNTGCASAKPMPVGAGPVPTPDTADAFLVSSAIASAAAAAAVPQGYAQVFNGTTGSVSQGAYLGFFNLQSYDTMRCSQYCNAQGGCTAFNIYFERDPSVQPQPGCDNPPSTINIRCSLWGLPVSINTATNRGQYQGLFQIAIAGSNGYNSVAAPSSSGNFTGPSALLGGAIQAPLLPNGQDPYIGVRMFPGAFNASQCAAVCQDTTAYDRQHPASDGTYKPCNFFNAYVLSKNNVALGTYCTFYTQPFSRDYATNTGSYDSDGNFYSVSQSYTYTLTTQDSGVVSS